MQGDRDHLIEAIQSAGHKAAFVVTGGGSGAVHALLSHSGASRFVLEVQIPYSSSAMIDYLGKEPESSCSEETARALAVHAYERALIFTLPQDNRSPILGIACTAALQTNRERKGRDRAFFCIKSRKRQVVRQLELEPASRAEQEKAVSDALLVFIADFLGVKK